MRSKPISKLRPGLYIVPTPIGNMEDITLRALDILSNVDRIACEDTRNTRRLLERHGIKARLIPYHEHNGAQMRPAIMARLTHGETFALVSDAGTPLISDPGYKLVQKVIASGIYLSSLPGPSASLSALTMSGLPTDRFMFIGFLPTKGAAKIKILEEIKQINTTLIIFESTNRLSSTLSYMLNILGNREIAVAREMTKIHEEIMRGDLMQISSHYNDIPSPKGEVVLVIGPPLIKNDILLMEDIDSQLLSLLQNHSVRDAVSTLSKETGLNRRNLYIRALEMQKGLNGDSH